MDKDFNIEDILSHSDIYYLMIANSMLKTMGMILEAFEDRNTQNDTHRFILSLIASFISVVYPKSSELTAENLVGLAEGLLDVIDEAVDEKGDNE